MDEFDWPLDDDFTAGDAALARQLQREEDERPRAQMQQSTPQAAAAATSSSDGSVDPASLAILQHQVTALTSAGPNVDVRALFRLYDCALFGSALGCVSVDWSKRMTSVAGSCSFVPASGFCRIGLSQPILQFRPLHDTLQTLLHEMIHAFLFVGPQRNTDRDDHGPMFLAQMHRLNHLLGLEITVYHSFHDECDHFKTHVWQCDGRCRHEAPYFGQVKRSMNRPPGKYDNWFERHEAHCGGTFVKIASPQLSQVEVEKKRARDEKAEAKEREQQAQKRQKNMMEAFVKPSQPAAATSSSTTSSPPKRKRTPKPSAAASSSASSASAVASSTAASSTSAAACCSDDLVDLTADDTIDMTSAPSSFAAWRPAQPRPLPPPSSPKRKKTTTAALHDPTQPTLDSFRSAAAPSRSVSTTSARATVASPSIPFAAAASPAPPMIAASSRARSFDVLAARAADAKRSAATTASGQPAAHASAPMPRAQLPVPSIFAPP